MFMLFLETQPLWVSGAIIVGLGTLLSLVGLAEISLILRHSIGRDASPLPAALDSFVTRQE